MQGFQEISISAVTPFSGGNMGRSFIRARVSEKGEIRTFNKKTGDGQGKLFSCVLNDKDSSIRGTFFNGAVDNVYHLIEEGKCYFFAGFSAKTANKQYTRVPNDYELTFDEKTCQVQNAPEDNTLPAQRYNFTLLQALPNKAKNTGVDVMAVVLDVKQPEDIQTKSGQNMRKLVCVIGEPSASTNSANASGNSIEATAWNDDIDKITNDPNFAPGNVVILKNAGVSDWNQCSLSIRRGTTISANANQFQQSQKYSDWYQNGIYHNAHAISQKKDMSAAADYDGSNSKMNFLGRRTLAAIADENLGTTDKSDFIDVVGCVSKFRLGTGLDTSLFYNACPNCNKKVEDTGAQGDQQWYCPKQCHNHYADHQINRRFLFTFEINDRVSEKWIQAYEEGGTSLFGMSGNDMHKYLREALESGGFGAQQSQQQQGGGGDDDEHGKGGERQNIGYILQKHLHTPFLMRLKLAPNWYVPRDGGVPPEGAETRVNQSGETEVRSTKITLQDAEPIKVDKQRSLAKIVAARNNNNNVNTNMSPSQRAATNKAGAAGGAAVDSAAAAEKTKQLMLDEISALQNMILYLAE